MHQLPINRAKFLLIAGAGATGTMLYGCSGSGSLPGLRRGQGAFTFSAHRTSQWPAYRPNGAVPLLRRPSSVCPQTLSGCGVDGGMGLPKQYTDADYVGDTYSSYNYSESYVDGNLKRQTTLGTNADGTTNYSVVTETATFTGSFPHLTVAHDVDYYVDPNHTIRFDSASGTALVSITPTNTQVTLSATISAVGEIATVSAVTSTGHSVTTNLFGDMHISRQCLEGVLIGFGLGIILEALIEAAVVAVCGISAGAACAAAVLVGFGLSQAVADALVQEMERECKN